MKKCPDPDNPTPSQCPHLGPKPTTHNPQPTTVIMPLSPEATPSLCVFQHPYILSSIPHLIFHCAHETVETQRGRPKPGAKLSSWPCTPCPPASLPFEHEPTT